ncbi:TetR/AcrR family transcriptional regulator [Aeromicrobium sp. Sec7.5]|uniref:TetR/AcrR family transcriptional regulator n=1 Tax=Aeromicrobium sp. Sec7.5 TaxID=3121276 RepID=UPI002FE4D06C
MTTSRPGLRKSPQQERSKHMVDRIVTAGRQVLTEHGYERATTNRVAEAAGISPGSLYQYFPNKEAVLSAVVDAYSNEITEQLTAVVTERLDRPPLELMRASYEGLLEILEANREYVRLMTRELPRARVAPHVDQIERRISELIGAYLAVSRPTDRVQPAVSAWLLVRMVEHLCVQWVLEEPGFSRETLLDELMLLSAAHLAPT